MTHNQKPKSEDITLKSLAERLRRLPQVQPSESLESKLLAAIPDGTAKPQQTHHFRWWPETWNFGAVAAASVVITALMFMVSYGLATPSEKLLTELDDTSLCYTGWDQNNLLYDQNSASEEKTWPSDFQWPVINQNEPNVRKLKNNRRIIDEFESVLRLS